MKLKEKTFRSPRGVPYTLEMMKKYYEKKAKEGLTKKQVRPYPQYLDYRAKL